MTGTGRLLLIAIPCLLAVAWGSDWLSAQPPATEQVNAGLLGAASPSSPGLVTHVIQQAGRPHTVVVADTKRAVLAVYHIDPQSGKLALKSVRNVSWDLQMPQYDTELPLPEEVRSGLKNLGTQ